jgi:hypothetical protein
MIVVSDTSPILNLARIDSLDLLHRLFGVVLVPPEVARELANQGFDGKPNWLSIRAPENRYRVIELAIELDSGESEAIVLAEEVGAELLLIDERRGTAVARQLGLTALGLLAVLARAKREGVIDQCGPYLNRLIAVGFWLAPTLCENFLRSVDERPAD